MNSEIKFDHFKNLEELKQNVENWLATDEMYWERWFGLRDIKTLLDIITNLDEKYKRYDKIKKENERLSKEVTKYDEILCERNNEVDRLYNIINELEKYIGQEYYCFDNESVEFEIAKNILNKLKELKEGK